MLLQHYAVEQTCCQASPEDWFWSCNYDIDNPFISKNYINTQTLVMSDSEKLEDQCY